jgi:ssDNA-binding Zn-finger/Zn-ribbon topoisomerase 1
LECQGAKRGKKKGRAAGGIIAGVKLGIKEKRQEKGEEGGCMERKMVENNDKIQQRDKDNKKRCGRCNKRKQRRMCAHGRVLQRENRRKRNRILGRGEEEWEKKIQRQGGKCREEEIDGMDRRKWMGSINGNKQGYEEKEEGKQ